MADGQTPDAVQSRSFQGRSAGSRLGWNGRISRRPVTASCWSPARLRAAVLLRRRTARQPTELQVRVTLEVRQHRRGAEEVVVRPELPHPRLAGRSGFLQVDHPGAGLRARRDHIPALGRGHDLFVRQPAAVQLDRRAVRPDSDQPVRVLALAQRQQRHVARGADELGPVQPPGHLRGVGGAGPVGGHRVVLGDLDPTARLGGEHSTLRVERNAAAGALGRLLPSRERVDDSRASSRRRRRTRPRPG